MILQKKPNTATVIQFIFKAQFLVILFAYIPNSCFYETIM